MTVPTQYRATMDYCREEWYDTATEMHKEIAKKVAETDLSTIQGLVNNPVKYTSVLLNEPIPLDFSPNVSEREGVDPRLT